VPRVELRYFRQADGSVPAIEWLEGLAKRPRAKCISKLKRLEQEGHELRRPEADLLRDGIHELRIGLSHINYRILYFFHGRDAVVVSHGLVKEREVPHREIDRAIERRQKFVANPAMHSVQWELDDEN
jgi:phage-related protein